MTDQHHAALRIGADAATVFGLLRHPSRHPETDAGGTVVAQVGDDPVTAVGDVFTMEMRFASGDGSVAEYRTDNHVDVYDAPGSPGEGGAIGWRTAGEGGPPFGWSWRYDLAPLDDAPAATRVTLTYDWSDAPDAVREQYGVPVFTPADLAASLRALEAAVTTG